MRKILTLLVLLVMVLAMGGCAAKFRIRTDLKAYQEIFKNKKVAIEEIFFYHDHDLEEKNGRAAGTPDISPEYMMLAKILKEETEKQLIKKGFAVVAEGSPNILKLKIFGWEKKVYHLGINHLIGAHVEAQAGEELLFSYFRAVFYNPLYSQERQIREKLAPALAEALEEMAMSFRLAGEKTGVRRRRFHSMHHGIGRGCKSATAKMVKADSENI
jgi:hypothetical protein